MRAALPLIAVLALVACGNPTAESDDPVSKHEPEETRIPVEADHGIGDGAGPMEDAAAISVAQIPARFHGVWDYEEGTCDPASDMRMEISADEILFYESIGRVTGVKAEGDDIIVSLDMEGEGENWQEKTRLSLVGKGDAVRLHTSDGERPKQPDEYPSKRCAS